MKQKSEKGLKPFVLKYMALLMGICYLANPMHEQISGVFHEISHVLESPEAILSHVQQSEHGHGAHEDGEHRLASDDHQHDLLDFLDAIFSASDKQHPEDDVALILIKCDKHISSQHIILPKIFPLVTSHNSLMVAQKVKKGFLNLPKEPPQTVSL